MAWLFLISVRFAIYLLLNNNLKIIRTLNKIIRTFDTLKFEIISPVTVGLRIYEIRMYVLDWKLLK